MKTLKECILESFKDLSNSEKGLKTIDSYLATIVSGYDKDWFPEDDPQESPSIILPDGSIDINLEAFPTLFGGEIILDKNFRRFPNFIQFNEVPDLKLKDCNITELPKEGTPRVVINAVKIENCKNLKNLKNCPKFKTTEYHSPHGKGLTLNNLPNLESLEGCPDVVPNQINIIDCPKLKSLKGLPKKCNYIWYVGDNFTEEDFKAVCDVKDVSIGYFNGDYNALK